MKDYWEVFEKVADPMQYPHDMFHIAVEFLNGNEDDADMVRDAFEMLAPGLYQPEMSRDELFTGLRKAMNV